MITNLIIFGLMLDIVGVLILVVVSILDPRYSRREDLKWWEKRYSWLARRPFYNKDTKTLKRKVKWTRRVIVNWIIPPKHQLNIIGFLFILGGFIFQIIGNL